MARPEEEDGCPVQTPLMIGMLVSGLTVAGTLTLMAPFVLSRSPLPYMATPGIKIRRALEFLAQRSSSPPRPLYPQNQHLGPFHPPHPALGEAPEMIFVDLGSGDGEAVYQAVQLGYRAVGIELNYSLYLVAQFRRHWRWTIPERARSSFLCQNMFQYNVANAHTVMIFGVTPLMTQLSHKLAAECRPGTHILSYRFKIPTDTSHQSKLLLSAKVIYDREEMRIYECTEKEIP